MAQYKTFTTCTDMGPVVSKLILELPATARANDVTAGSFSVYAERMDLEQGGIALAAEHRGGPLLPSRGYVDVLAAYVCDEKGNAVEAGTYVALELTECRLTKRIDGDVMRGYIRGMEYRVTQLRSIPAETPGDAPVVGLVFDECAGDVCPALDGWSLDGVGTFAGVEMNYAWFEPNVAAINAFRALPGFFHQDPLPQKLPLLLWLHGAGEGQEPYPDGKGQLVDDNQSFYTEALKALVDEFVAAHADAVDTKRIYVGGLSNGGFMTCRLITEYPGFFAAAVPVCAPWVGDLATDEEFAAMAKTPMWWVQSDDDPIVPVATHFKPSWERLVKAGAQDLHATYFDHIVDANGAPLIGHFVWVQAYNDEPKTDLDGSLVCWDGFPVTLWQWVGKHSMA